MKSSSLLALLSVALASASPLLGRDQSSNDTIVSVAKGSSAPVAHTGDIPPPSPNGTTDGKRDIQARNNYDWIQWSDVYTWPEGTPVGGDSLLTIWSSGYSEFKTHFHDSGWPSYDVIDTCILHDLAGRAYTFSHSGRMHGTDESGSRDFDQDETIFNSDIQTYWSDIENGNLLLYCSASVS